MIKKQMIAGILALSMSMSLFGCQSTGEGNNTSNDTKDVQAQNQSMQTETVLAEESFETESIQEEVIESGEESEIDVETIDIQVKDDYGFTEQQRNSVSMLYYLAITAEEIRTSKDSRLMLEDVYTSLLNDINPSAIDEITQDHLDNLRDIIKSYMSISVKRERLQYIYNQEKASAMRNAVPNPLSVLAMTNAFDWKRLVVTVAYTAIDSYNNYKLAEETADMNFLMSGWELDDEETMTIQNNRERAFNYMVDIVQEYSIDGKLTLNEQDIDEFVKICKIEAPYEKIHRLRSEEKTYRLLGNYWLELANCYYDIEEYENCLNCVEEYNNLSTGIYRNDYNYVQILPKAIVAAQEIYTADEYILNIEKFVNSIVENTNSKDWSLRYFAAQVYLDLYARTNNRSYLEQAYNISYDNVTVLLDEQRKLNISYLEDIQEMTAEEPDYDFMSEDEKKEAEKQFKEEKKRVKAYNKELKKTRETELPTLYEPLVLNCELLFALADEMNISDKEKTEIEAILQSENNGIFLVDPINNRYSFNKSSEIAKIELTKNKMIIPVKLLSDGAYVEVTVLDNGNTTLFDDFNITKVVRKGDEIETFSAYLSSNKMKNYKWTANSNGTIKIVNGDENLPLIINYRVTEFKDNSFFPDEVVFEIE